MNLFSRSLIGTTIQDGSIREKEMTVTYDVILNPN